MSDQISAFPVTDTGITGSPYAETGMSLRDYFAAKAMQAQIQCGEFVTKQHTAFWAYEVADAMLAEREKQ
jgi:hypothetical protein